MLKFSKGFDPALSDHRKDTPTAVGNYYNNSWIWKMAHIRNISMWLLLCITRNIVIGLMELLTYILPPPPCSRFFSFLILFNHSFDKSYHIQNFNHSLKFSVFRVKGSARSHGVALIPERSSRGTSGKDMGAFLSSTLKIKARQHQISGCWMQISNPFIFSSKYICIYIYFYIYLEEIYWLFYIYYPQEVIFKNLWIW